MATISGTVIDGKVTFVRGTNLRGSSSQNCQPGCIDELDESLGSSTSSAYLEHQINRVADSTGQEVMAEIRVEFFLAGTTTTNLALWAALLALLGGITLTARRARTCA